MVTIITFAQSSKNCTILPHIHFEKANATFLAEHNIISAIVLCIQKAASEAIRAFTYIFDLNASKQNILNCWTKFYSRLFCIVSLIATHLRSTVSILLSCQTRRHSGAYRGRAPPNENCALPSEDCAPKKLTGSGLLDCKSRPKLVFFVH